MKKLAISAAVCALLGTSFSSYADLTPSADGKTIYESHLQLTWLADANYAKTAGHSGTGAMNWIDATTWADQLTILGNSDWRLPTVEEMDHLFYWELGGISTNKISDVHNPQYALFSGIQSSYWSNTEKTNDPGSALGFHFNHWSASSGFSFEDRKTGGQFAMLVTSVPEPETYAMLLAGLGLLGWRMRRSVYFSPIAKAG